MKFTQMKILIASLAAAVLLSTGTAQAESISDLKIEFEFDQLTSPDFWSLAASRMSVPVMPGTAIGYQTQSLREAQPNWRRSRESQLSVSTQTLIQG